MVKPYQFGCVETSMKPHVINKEGFRSIQAMVLSHRVLLASSRTIPEGPTKTLEADLSGEYIVRLGDSSKYYGNSLNDAIEVYNGLL